jgi:hypothetical protein
VVRILNGQRFDRAHFLCLFVLSKPHSTERTIYNKKRGLKKKTIKKKKKRVKVANNSPELTTFPIKEVEKTRIMEGN